MHAVRKIFALIIFSLIAFSIQYCTSSYSESTVQETMNDAIYYDQLGVKKPKDSLRPGINIKVEGGKTTKFVIE